MSQAPMIYPVPEAQRITGPDGVEFTHARLTQITADGALPIAVVFGTLDADGNFQAGPPPYNQPVREHMRPWKQGEIKGFRELARGKAKDAGAPKEALPDIFGRGSDLIQWLDTYGLVDNTWEPAE